MFRLLFLRLPRGARLDDDEVIVFLKLVDEIALPGNVALFKKFDCRREAFACGYRRGRCLDVRQYGIDEQFTIAVGFRRGGKQTVSDPVPHLHAVKLVAVKLRQFRYEVNGFLDKAVPYRFRLDAWVIQTG